MSIKNTYCQYRANLKFYRKVNEGTLKYNTKFKVSPVSATCIFYTKNTKICWNHPFFISSFSNICCIVLKFGTVLRFMATYLHIKFHISTVSAVSTVCKTYVHMYTTSKGIELENPGCSGFEANLKSFKTWPDLDFLAQFV